MANFGVPIDGAVLRALRDDRMWSLADLARRAREVAAGLGEPASLDRATICRAETGASPKLAKDTLRFLVAALAPSQEEARRLLRGAELPGALVALCSDAPGRQVEDPVTLAATVAELAAAVARLEALINQGGSLGGATSGQEEDMHRSEFLRGALALALGLAPPAAVERLARPGRGGVDETLVTAYENVAAGLWRAYHSVTTGRESLLVAVGRQAAGVREVLRLPMSGAHRARLSEVAVGLHAEGGMLGLHLHDLDVADACFAWARSIAQDSGSLRLQAQALQASTHMLCSLRYGGSGGNDPLALTLAEQAADYGAGADAHTRAETWLRLADFRALDGDEPGFQRALEQAHREFPRIDGSETGFSARAGSFVSPRMLHAAAGMGNMVLGRHDDALAALGVAAHDPAMQPRGVVDMCADLGRVYVQLGEPEQACAELTAALDIAEPIDYRLGVARVHGARALFDRRWAPLSYVLALDDRLRVAAQV